MTAKYWCGMGAKYWCGPVPEKDDFGCPIKHEVGGVFYDAKTDSGPWAIMAPCSWAFDGYGKLGLGFGQKYEMQQDGRWLKVEG